MKYKTYNNVMKAIKMIQKKGYSFDEANEMAIRLFDEHTDGMNSIEFYIDKILDKDTWKREYGITQGNKEGFNVDEMKNMNINMEKLSKHVESGDILEFQSDQECLDYFNTYDFQDFKTVDEMKAYQGKYGFNIENRRYHINIESALDVHI